MRSARENLKFFDDIAKMATGAFGSLGEIRQLIRKQVQEGVDQILSKMDLVTRDEFERVEGMAEKARLHQQALEKRLAALEKSTKGPAAKSAGAPTAKRKKK
ncbi:MAG: accessory factor UbiK family protein [Micavibrio sp.]|nr:accessory factor UbiK family protein [Micavibrio sp.]